MDRSALAEKALLFLALVSASFLNATDVPSVSGTTAPFELGFNFLVIVKGRVGELDGLKFILDTGSSHTVIDEKVANSLRLQRRPGKITNFDREMPVKWTEIRELQAGPIRATGVNVIVAKLGDYSEFAQGVDGLIGLDLLSRGKKLSIDYERQIVSFDATQDGILRGDNEVAGESKFETAAKRDSLDCRDGGHPQRFNRAIGQIDFRDKGTEPVDVLAGPFPHLAPETEVRPLRLDHQNADIALAGVMNRLPKTFRKLEVEAVVRRIGEHDASNGVLAFESNGLLHGLRLLSAAARCDQGITGISRCEGCSASW